MRESYWIATSEGAEYPSVDEHIEAECVIVGGGITGITVAYLLSKMGKSCVLVDSGKLGSGTTGRNTGKVSYLHGVTYSEIKHKYGVERAKDYYHANYHALRFIEDTISQEKIDCGFEKVPAYVYTKDRSMLPKIVEEFEVAKEIGITCTLEKHLDMPIEIEGALKFTEQAQMHPKAYIDQLAAKAKAYGAQIYEHTPVLNIKKEEDYVLYTDQNKKIIANTVVLCSHFPVYDYKTLFFSKLKPERSYVVAGEIEETYGEGIYINIEEPRRSFRTVHEEGRTLLLVGGENHKVGQGGIEENHYDQLKKYGKDVFGINKYCYEWSAEDYVTHDHLPYIGYVEQKNPSLYVATGFSKWGLTNGTVAAIMLSDFIVGRGNKWEDVFAVTRKTDMMTQAFWRENFDVAKHYIKGKLGTVEGELPTRIGEGKIVEIEGKRYGAYRDEQEALHIVDITCTHLGCELVWNGAERSWDCPCHGSRFSYTGEVLDGPATLPLHKFGEESNTISPHIMP